MDGSKPMDVSSLKGVKLSDTESRLDHLAESLNSGEPIEAQKNFQIPQDFEKTLEKGRSEALKFLTSDDSVVSDVAADISLQDSKNEDLAIVNKFWKLEASDKSTPSQAVNQTPLIREAEQEKLNKKKREVEEEYYDDDLLDEDCYDFAEENPTFMEEEDLNNAISEITGKLKLYPEIDHIDYLKYLNNTEGVLKRDVLMYFRGVQKNNTCSATSRSMELISKLEAVVAMSLKNSSHTATNLKLSGEQLAKISQIKDSKSTAISQEEKRIVPPKVSQSSNKKKNVSLGQKSASVTDKVETEWKPTGKIREEKPLQENSLKIFRNIENPQDSLVVQELPKDLNVQLVETPSLRESKVKAFSRGIGISDRIIENPKAWAVLYSTITDQVIETAGTKDEEYRNMMKKAILGKISKAIQGA
nr:phosphoprotein [Cytorhabdovirus sp.]